MQQFCFGWKSVLQSNLKNEIFFFCLLIVTFMETLPHGIERTRIISSVIQDGVRVLLVNCLSSFRSRETVRTLKVSTCHKV